MLFKAKEYSIMCMTPIFFIHLSADGHLGCCIMHSTAVDMGVQGSLWYAEFISFGYRAHSGIAGSYGRSFLVFENLPYCSS
jgi:hypothetical protein